MSDINIWNVVPIRGEFDSPKTLLMDIANDPNLEAFVIYVETKQGTMKRAHRNMSKGSMAYAGANALSWSQAEVMD